MGGKVSHRPWTREPLTPEAIDSFGPNDADENIPSFSISGPDHRFLALVAGEANAKLIVEAPTIRDLYEEAIGLLEDFHERRGLATGPDFRVRVGQFLDRVTQLVESGSI